MGLKCGAEGRFNRSGKTRFYDGHIVQSQAVADETVVLRGAGCRAVTDRKTGRQADVRPARLRQTVGPQPQAAGFCGAV
jgi:hypothetical protein